MLAALARACHRRRWTTLVLWLLAALALASAGGMAGPEFDAGYDLPDTDSQHAYDLMERHFPDQAAGRGAIVLHAPRGLGGRAVQERVDEVLAAARGTGGSDVRRVAAPGDAAAGGRISADGRTGLAPIVFAMPRTEVPDGTAHRLEDRLTKMSGDGLQVELAGSMFAPEPGTGLSETVGLAAAVVILVAAFGSLVLAGLPVVAAVVGLLATLGLVMLLTKAMAVPDFSMSVAMMIVLGVGVDYSLFLATRYRTARRDGLPPAEAAGHAAATSGRAVLFAGTAVIVSLGGMLAMGVPFVYGLAVSCALGVLATLALAVTLVPALLGLTDRWLCRPGVLERRRRTGEGRVWTRLHALQRRRGLALTLGGTAVLLALCAPATAMRLGTADAGDAPATATTRQAYELEQRAFGPGSTAPLLVVADLDGAPPRRAEAVAERLRHTPGVAGVVPPAVSKDGRAALITVFPAGAAQDASTPRLVRGLRAHVLPAAAGKSPVRLYVGGQTATSQDLTDRMADRLLVFVLAVVVLSLLVLAAMFRSVLIPVQAVLLTLLSLGAAYGLLTAVFQWGWGRGLFGTGPTGPLESYMPMTLMALLFGLSVDYQVFVLTRIKEAYARGGDAARAVAEGTRAAGRVVLAAALIMAAVFAGFALSPDRIMKQFGLGLAAAILVEAAAVLLITPAVLLRLGDRVWRTPAREASPAGSEPAKV